MYIYITYVHRLIVAVLNGFHFSLTDLPINNSNDCDPPPSKQVSEEDHPLDVEMGDGDVNSEEVDIDLAMHTEEPLALSQKIHNSIIHSLLPELKKSLAKQVSQCWQRFN